MKEIKRSTMFKGSIFNTYMVTNRGSFYTDRAKWAQANRKNRVITKAREAEKHCPKRKSAPVSQHRITEHVSQLMARNSTDIIFETSSTSECSSQQSAFFISNKKVSEGYINNASQPMVIEQAPEEVYDAPRPMDIENKPEEPINAFQPMVIEKEELEESTNDTHHMVEQKACEVSISIVSPMDIEHEPRRRMVYVPRRMPIQKPVQSKLHQKLQLLQPLFPSRAPQQPGGQRFHQQMNYFGVHRLPTSTYVAQRRAAGSSSSSDISLQDDAGSTIFELIQRQRYPY